MIYICIPTHNEQQTVGVVLWKLRQVFADFPRDYQLLVADDASTDKTLDVLEPYTRVLPLTVIRNEKRLGFAGSLEMLIREAIRRSEYPKRDVVVTMQADFSDEPDDLIPLLKRMEAGADVALGNKVSKSKPTRIWRFSRGLARFFMRSQKWPETVPTPFEGFRAYRLYALKKAVEDGAGRRLLKHDSWAGHAELLQAVLPHARRIDAVDVVDRTDRLQRPRREKPFASAMQVRTLSSRVEPQGLTRVEELDRIAATASRSRDRSTSAVRERAGQAATTRGNGGSRREGSGSDRQRRPIPESRPRRTAGAQEGESRSGRSQPARPRGRAAAAQEAGAAEKPEQKPARTRTRNRPARTAEAAKPESEALVEPGAAGDAAVAAGDAAAPRPKRKRRRRRRSGTGSAEAAQATDVSSADAQDAGGDAAEGAAGTSHENAGRSRPESGADADAGSEDAPAEGGEGEATGEKKRRRRGGRRGGRGRKRSGRTEGTGESGSESAPEGESQPDRAPHDVTAAPSAEVVSRPEE